MAEVRWSEIEAECGDYRAGFVDTFRKYEGDKTDEKDGQGRTVKVTVASFARHMRIPPETFRDWTKKQDGGARVPARPSRDTVGARKVLREADGKELQSLVDDLPGPQVRKLAEAAERAQQSPKLRAAHDEMKRRQDELSPAEWKADQAKHDERMRPLRDAVAKFGGGFVATLELALEELRERESIDSDECEGAKRLLGELAEEIEIKHAMASLEVR